MKLSLGLAVLFCSAAWCADYHPLNVKTGEWQSTLSGQATGQLPIPDEVLNKLTPEQRAKMEAAMRAHGGALGPTNTVTKSCLTKQDLDKPFDMGEEAMKSCARTIVSSSGSRQEIHMDCNREGIKGSGVVKIEATDSENVKGTVQMTMTSGERTMHSNYNFAAKWLGSKCTEDK
jgi:Protein of unknown function (DUF3617)